MPKKIFELEGTEKDKGGVHRPVYSKVTGGGAKDTAEVKSGGGGKNAKVADKTPPRTSSKDTVSAKAPEIAIKSKRDFVVLQPVSRTSGSGLNKKRKFAEEVTVYHDE